MYKIKKNEKIEIETKYLMVPEVITIKYDGKETPMEDWINQWKEMSQTIQFFCEKIENLEERIQQLEFSPAIMSPVVAERCKQRLNGIPKEKLTPIL